MKNSLKILQVLIFQIIIMFLTDLNARVEDNNIQALLHRAAIARSEGNYELTSSLIRKSHALRIEKYDSFSPEIANSYINLARIQSYNWEYDSALLNLGIAENIYKKCEQCNSSILGKIYFRIGDIYYDTGDFLLATNYYSQTKKHFEDFPETDPRLLAFLFLKYAALELELGNSRESLHFLQKAYNAINADPNNHSLLIDYYINLANTETHANGRSSSISILKKGLTIALEDSVHNVHNIAIIHNNLGMDYMAIGEYPQSLYHLGTALEIRHKFNGDGTSRVQLYESLSQLYSKMGDIQNSIKYIQDALYSITPEATLKDSLDNPLLEDLSDMLMALLILKQKSLCLKAVYEENKDFAVLNKAIETSLLTIDVIDALRENYQSFESKLKTTELEYGIYSSALELIWTAYQKTKEQKYAELAFRVSEKSKSALLVSALQDLDARQFGNIPDSLLSEQQQLNKTITFYKQKIYEEQQFSNPDSTRLTNWERYLFESIRKHEQLIAILETEYPKYYDLKYSKSLAEVSTIQKQLPRETNLIQYSLMDTILYSFCVSNKAFHFDKQLLTREFTDNIEEYLQNFHHFDFSRQSLSDFTNFTWLSKSLYDVLIKPNEKYIVGNQLLIVPDGSLSYLPFETLIKTIPDGIAKNHYKSLDYLIKDYSISYSFSSTFMLKTNERRQKPKINNLLAIAPNYKANYQKSTEIERPLTRQDLRKELSPIPGALEEVKAISQLIPSKLLLNTDATEDNFKKEAIEYDILHLAMHTIIDNNNPLYSKLIFTHEADSFNDGLLNTYEVFSLNLNARMVVLSACGTGKGKLNRGEGVMSLARGFVYAGTPSLVMTMWEVEDKSGSILMNEFYKGILNGKTKNEALRQAKLKFLEEARPENAHPFFWSSFVVVGNNDPLYTGKSLLWIISLLILSIGATIIVIRRKERTVT